MELESPTRFSPSRRTAARADHALCGPAPEVPLGPGVVGHGVVSDTDRMARDHDVRVAAAAVAAQGELGCYVAYGTDARHEEIARIAVRRLRSIDRRHKGSSSRSQQIEDLAKGLRQRFATDPKLEDLNHYRCVARAVIDALDPQPDEADGDASQRGQTMP